MTTAANPTRPPELPPGPDHLAGAVLSSLVRPAPASGWGTLRTLILSVVSFGLLPLIVWPLRLRDQIVVEQQRLWHLAEWMRLRSGQEAAQGLQRSAERMQFQAAFWLIIALALLWLGLVAAPHLSARHRPFSLDRLIRQTYSYGYHHHGLAALRSRHNWQAPGVDHTAAATLFIVWTAALSAGYLAQWLHVRSHMGQVRRFIQQFNVLAQREGIAGVTELPTGGGFHRRWVVLAVGMAAAGAWWGIPMALVGALQQHHSRHLSPLARQGLAESLREMLRRQRPWMSVPMPVRLGRHCPTPRCGQLLPPEARFCPRCGAAVGGVPSAR